MADFTDILQQGLSSAKCTAALKQALVEKSKALAALPVDQATGRKVVKRMTRIIDDLVGALYHRAVISKSQPKSASKGLCLVAVGGYGRGELNPHSDIDLMFLYDPRVADRVESIANEVLYPLWDLGRTVGHSIRTLSDCVELGLSDLSARTAMMEPRLLAGDGTLYETFEREFAAKVVRKDVSAYIYQKVEEQQNRHQRFGATVYLQQPNVKESPGGLRDIHHLVWLAIARHGIGDLKQLMEEGLLDEDDYGALSRAQGFLWRVRNELHFASNKNTDVLTFEEQLHISERLGFVDSKTSRAVERFMRHYLLHASKVQDICLRFTERTVDRRLTQALSDMIFSRRVAPCFVLTGREIKVETDKLEAFLEDGPALLNLFHLAQSYGLTIHPETAEFLSHQRVRGRNLRTPKAARVFMTILGWDRGVATALDRMHRMHVLSRILPEFARVERLVTFSQYHKYTVDAHTLHALELAETLHDADDIFGKTFRGIRRKDLLYLALLLHDAGKAHEGEHSKVGEQMAMRVGPRLGLNEKETATVAFLVREHLYMSHVAFRRDLSDDAVLTMVARRIQTPELLKMLFVLTHLDIRAVGPDTWNSYKRDLLTELYARTLESLAGRRMVVDMEQSVAQVRDQVRAQMGAKAAGWIDESLDNAPGRYLVHYPVDDICRHMTMMRELKDRPAQVAVRALEHGEEEITVCAHDLMVPALFSKIAGTLTAKDLQVLDARISTFRDDVVVDVFRVRDPKLGERTDAARWKRVKKSLEAVLLGKQAVEGLFEGGHGRVTYEEIDFSKTEPVVRIDNDVSDSFTVLDVFAADRQGLLYHLTRAISELDLHIFFSRIATNADQVVDVFYIKDRAGKKVTDIDRIEAIRTTLLEVIEQAPMAV